MKPCTVLIVLLAYGAAIAYLWADLQVTELAMKIIKLDSCAFALEPQDPADRIGALDIDRLRGSGISEAAIDIYRRYQSGLVDSGSPIEVKAGSPMEAVRTLG